MPSTPHRRISAMTGVEHWRIRHLTAWPFVASGLSASMSCERRRSAASDGSSMLESETVDVSWLAMVSEVDCVALFLGPVDLDPVNVHNCFGFT